VTILNETAFIVIASAAKQSSAAFVGSGLLRRHSVSKTRANALTASRNDGTTRNANQIVTL
jgi:hypothetical protein